MTRSATHGIGSDLPRRLVLLALGAALVPGCAAFREAPLDVPPGHQAVAGEVWIKGFSEPRIVLDVAREDGSYQHELVVDAAQSPFVITLPRGRYVIRRLRINDNGRVFPEEAWFRMSVVFDVGDTVVYVGTLDIERVVFARQLRVLVRDEYERTVPAMRKRYPELPSVVTRSLMRPD
jgi:hypothetical protein